MQSYTKLNDKIAFLKKFLLVEEDLDYDKERISKLTFSLKKCIEELKNAYVNQEKFLRDLQVVDKEYILCTLPNNERVKIQLSKNIEEDSDIQEWHIDQLACLRNQACFL